MTLLSQAIEIRDANMAGENTAVRVGDWMVDAVGEIDDAALAAANSLVLATVSTRNTITGNYYTKAASTFFLPVSDNGTEGKSSANSLRQLLFNVNGLAATAQVGNSSNITIGVADSVAGEVRKISGTNLLAPAMAAAAAAQVDADQALLDAAAAQTDADTANAAIVGINSQLALKVALAGTQTITGQKTFSLPIVLGTSGAPISDSVTNAIFVDGDGKTAQRALGSLAFASSTAFISNQFALVQAADFAVTRGFFGTSLTNGWQITASGISWNTAGASNGVIDVNANDLEFQFEATKGIIYAAPNGTIETRALFRQGTTNKIVNRELGTGAFATIADYLTVSAAAATYLTIANAASTYLTSASAAATYVALGGSYADPSWVTSLDWDKITATPSTLAGYGITDAAPISGSANYIQDQNVGVQSADFAVNSGYFGTSITNGFGISVNGIFWNTSGSNNALFEVLDNDLEFIFNASKGIVYDSPAGAGTETSAIFEQAGTSRLVNRTLGTGAFATIADYLTTASAASTYLTMSAAASNYLTISNAASTYATNAGFKAFAAYLTTNQSISSGGGYETMIFDGETYDTANNYNPATGIITIPAGEAWLINVEVSTDHTDVITVSLYDTTNTNIIQSSTITTKGGVDAAGTVFFCPRPQVGNTAYRIEISQAGGGYDIIGGVAPEVTYISGQRVNR
jgi:hypothetical protein